jgi:DNA-binding MarR family transcriptional regulator
MIRATRVGVKRDPATWPPHTGDETHLVREIIRTQQAIIASFSSSVGMPASRLGLIRQLAVHKLEGAGVIHIARQLGIHAAAVTRQLDALEEMGLVERTGHEGDGRRVTVRLTPKGVRLFERVHERAHAFERSLTAEVSKKDIGAAIRVLTAARAVIAKSSVSSS